MSTDIGARELDVVALRRVCPPESLGFDSTAEVAALEGAMGQWRAEEAIAFGLEAHSTGCNIFVTGPAGTGKRTFVESRLRKQARERAAPADLVYLHNFREPRRPIAAALATGRGPVLAADMRRFLEDARHELARAFEGETYARRRRTATEPLEQEQGKALAELREQAQTGGIALELTPSGVMTVPLRGDHPMTPAEFAQLPDTVRARYQSNLEELQPLIEGFLTHMRARQRNAVDAVRELDRQVALFAIGHLVDELKERHRESPQVVTWLEAVTEDVTENLDRFRTPDHEHPGRGELPDSLLAAMGAPEDPFRRYAVNVLVTQLDGCSPVVVEMNPTYPNLFGRIEYRGVLGGGLATDHLMLRPGAVHRATGGYLMLPAAEVLGQPLVWLKLKELLRTGSIRLENPADQYALIPTSTLTPEPIDLDLKVVLVGASSLYALAYALDEDFRKLFQVKAEFDWRVPWDDEGIRGYAEFLSAEATAHRLLHFDAAAVGRIVEHGARLAEDRERLSTRLGELGAIAAEASHWAAQDACELVGASHIDQAIEHKATRSNLLEQRLLEMVAEGTLMIDVEGERVGQINGLSVLDLGDYSFGRPVRITATAGPGRGALVSIEREAELSGHLHDKGFLTIAGYLRARYGAERRIALSATLSFEQSYDRIDGDSASSAELYALLSELAGLPLRQDIAVTGSVNQHGELQAIGAVNEKIEGFYRTCKLAGLTGHQGVLIPAANERNLMLSGEVVDSVAGGMFHVWSAHDVDAGLALLTGVATGIRDAEGRFPPGTLHARVDERLDEWARTGDQELPGIHAEESPVDGRH
jgi:predicted ATP-dependent protease